MSDERPANCRFRLKDEGKAYPKSGCMGCGRNIATGLGNSCHKILPTPPSPVAITDAESSYISWICNQSAAAMVEAKVKFPQPNYVTLKVAEEAGEVVRGAVHYAEGRLSWGELENEAIQTIAMILRLLTEGDEINGVIPPAFRLEELKGA